MKRLGDELGAARREIGRLQGLLDRTAASSSGEAADEARRREAIARPALVARLSGDPEQQEDRLRRNVSWHAQRCPAASAPPGEWRRAQRGPRLGARRPRGGAGLRADAEVFVPAGGVWEPLGCWEPPAPSAGLGAEQACGVRCSCGAVAFSGVLVPCSGCGGRGGEPRNPARDTAAPVLREAVLGQGAEADPPGDRQDIDLRELEVSISSGTEAASDVGLDLREGAGGPALVGGGRGVGGAGVRGAGDRGVAAGELGPVGGRRAGGRGSTSPRPRRHGAKASSPRPCHGDATAAERRRAPDVEWYTCGEFEFFEDPEGHVWRRCAAEAGSKALAEEWYAERQAPEAKLRGTWMLLGGVTEDDFEECLKSPVEDASEHRIRRATGLPGKKGFVLHEAG